MPTALDHRDQELIQEYMHCFIAVRLIRGQVAYYRRLGSKEFYAYQIDSDNFAVFVGDYGVLKLDFLTLRADPIAASDWVTDWARANHLARSKAA